MKRMSITFAAIFATLWGAGMTVALAFDYTVADLLEPCVEGDNDSRWGAAAEAECEQYIMGFLDAAAILGAIGKEENICLPEQNREDEVRWAFMRWAHENFDQRSMPAAEGLLATIRAKMACN